MITRAVRAQMTGVAAQDPALIAALADAVVRRGSDAVVEQDVDGVVTTWNTTASRLLGSPEDEARGKPFAQFVDPDHLLEWQRAVAAAAGGAAVDLPEIMLRRADGLTVHASAYVTPARDGAGDVVGACVVVQDHTERQLAQDALAAAEERVRRSESLAGTGSFVLDGADGSVQWSEGMHRIFATEPLHFDGTREGHLGVVAGEERERVEALLDAALLIGRSTETDHRAVVEGRPVWMFLAVEPVRDGSGRITGVRGLYQDITARKAAEESVRSALELAERANEELRALDALKDEFLATVSHELRTPLTSIIGFSRLLATKAPDLAMLVEPISRGGADMARMIEKLLDYARLQAGHVALQPEPVMLAPVVDGYLASHSVAGLDQELLNEVPADLCLVTDPNALERVLGNLIGNASRYAGEGRSVRVRAQVDDDGSTLLAVSDDGPGIPVEHQQHLFERFFQVPGASTRRGTGIGLAIVREYVHQQGGTVWCQSRPGEGTTFFVRLPRVGAA
jgi:PAS domain S-box-containing protein